MSADVAADLLDFLATSPTPYHAVASAIARLSRAGFTPLEERAAWSELAAGRYYVVAGGTAIAAFVVPRGSRTAGFRIVGAHTDSPNLRLKPRTEYTREGYLQLGVEVYGGVLLNSWLDRDLALAGRVMVRGAQGRIEPRLLRFDKPLLRIPQLAIHLDRDVNEKGLVLNRQEHLAPVWGLAADGTHTGLAAVCARELGVAAEAILAMDLMLYDTVAPARGGARGEFVFSARLDNQAMCHAAVRALIDAAPRAEADGGELVPLAVLFDHEEVGSQSAVGAGSAFLPRVLERIAARDGSDRDGLHRALAGSLCVSADMSHAVHPNYAERHEARHRPVINGGPVIKSNAQQRYATSAATAAMFRVLCKSADVPVQEFTNRTDMPCGSTIGPITSTQLGIRTVDVGNAMLSMHSIREMAGTEDPALMTRVLASFYTAADPEG